MNKIFTFAKNNLFLYAFGAALITLFVCIMGIAITAAYFFIDTISNNIPLEYFYYTAKVTWFSFFATIVLCAVGGLSLLYSVMSIRYNK
jgi:hypothetical protein